jgi:hypothetical protein
LYNPQAILEIRPAAFIKHTQKLRISVGEVYKPVHLRNIRTGSQVVWNPKTKHMVVKNIKTKQMYDLRVNLALISEFYSNF